MSTSPEKIQELKERRAELKAKLVGVGDLRPGSLVERYRRCGKAGCHCAGKEAPGHGPSWSLTRGVAGKTVTRIVPAAAVPDTRNQIAEYRRFRRLVREMVETSEQLCDAQLNAPEAALQEVAKKGGSKKSLKRKSSPRSKIS